MKGNLLIVIGLLVFCVNIGPNDCRGDTDTKSRDDMHLLYHDLDMANQKAKRENKVSIELADMESAYDACLGRAAALEECRNKISDLHDKLQSRVHDAQMLAEEKKQTELLRQQADAAKTPQSITIIENSSQDDYFREHHHNHRGFEREKEKIAGPTPPAGPPDFRQR